MSGLGGSEDGPEQAPGMARCRVEPGTFYPASDPAAELDQAERARPLVRCRR
jgi:hypothetical protein